MRELCNVKYYEYAVNDCDQMNLLSWTHDFTKVQLNFGLPEYLLLELNKMMVWTDKSMIKTVLKYAAMGLDSRQINMQEKVEN